MMIYLIVLIFGFSLGISFVYLVEFLRNKKTYLKVEEQFKYILDNFSRVLFNKRINQYVYLKFDDHELIYILDTKEIHIFNKEKCIYTSNQILGSKVISNLESEIVKRWGIDINNVISINNSIVSVNLVKTELKKLGTNDYDLDTLLSSYKVEYNLDDILDKINQIGYDNLTNEEKEFLKNVS